LKDTKKNDIVTGAARGIGRGIAFKLALEGFLQTLLDIRKDTLDGVEKEIRSRCGDVVHCLAVDISDHAQVDRAVRLHVEKFGGVDLLVNNAGINLRKSSCEETTDLLVEAGYYSALVESRRITLLPCIGTPEKAAYRRNAK